MFEISPRWYSEQFYVTDTKHPIEGKYNVNGKNGTTVSIKKRGGLGPAWVDARILANWKSEAGAEP